MMIAWVDSAMVTTVDGCRGHSRHERPATPAMKLPRLLPAVLFFACTGLCAADRIHRYEVTVDPQLLRLDVQACFSGRPPAELSAESLDASGAFVEGRVADRRQSIVPNGTDMKLKDLPDNGCIRYSVDITRLPSMNDAFGAGNQRVGRDLLTSTGVWFWRPAEMGIDEDIEVAFFLPPGMGVSAPWPPVSPARDVPTFKVGRGAFDRPSNVAFGRFEEVAIEVPGAVLRVAILDGTPPMSVESTRRWLHDAASSVASIYGRFPVRSPQVLVLPGARAAESAPWAFVSRGGAAAVHFEVNQRRPLREFVDDWTAAHELSHLLLPYISLNESWLSEGIASYYQNIARARSGAVAPEEAWQRMHSSFRRAAEWAARSPNVTLAQATARLYRDGGYMRVYWSGAAILMLADIQLREQSAGSQSLDSVLGRFADCCLDPDPEWSSRQVFAKWDELSGTAIFGKLYEQYVDAGGFPDLAPVYARIGLEPLGGKIALLGAAPQIAVRDAIMARGSYTTPADLIDRR